VKLLISAAETSSDAHGAELLKALRTLGPVDAFGVGGPKLQASGLRSVVDARELLAMGFFEVFGRLPRIFRALREMRDAARDEKPDVAIVIDYPDFHFRLARRLRKLGIPVIYYIPPKVWVWRKSRIRVLKENFARVLSILPFEREFYEREGVPVRYVGNPLVDELPLKLTRAQARIELALPEISRVLVALPGSRPAEIKRHVDLMLDGATRAAALLRNREFLGARERLVVLMPFPVTANLDAVREQVSAWLSRMGAEAGGESRFILDVRVSQGDAAECMVAADAGLIKSGTSTLEAALLRCPHAVVYKPNWFTEWAFKNLVRYRGPVGLSNLVAGWSPGKPFAFNEILCSDATPEALAAEVVSLFEDLPKRLRLSQASDHVRSRIFDGAPDPVNEVPSPSLVAAREVMDVAGERRR
jgi:lipid-A-disaccharide synthase